jgi:hypothetical protein
MFNAFLNTENNKNNFFQLKMFFKNVIQKVKRMRRSKYQAIRHNYYRILNK